MKAIVAKSFSAILSKFRGKQQIDLGQNIRRDNAKQKILFMADICKADISQDLYEEL